MLATKYMQREALKKGNIETMRTYKGKGSTGWTGIDNNVINNKLLSVQARFILIFILSKNENKDEINQEIIADNCNLSVKQVSRYLNELKTYKHLKINKEPDPNNKNKFTYKYSVNEHSSVLPVDINHRTSMSCGKNINKTSVKPSDNKQLEDIKPVDTIGHEPQDIDVRFLYNTIINNTDDNTKKNHHEISDLENIENSLIEFADKSDSKKACELFDEIIYNSGVFNFPMNDQRIKNIKLDNIPKSIKKNNLSLVLEVIKNFPGYVQKTNDGLNPKGSFSENEMLIYFKTILANDCQYPKWFNSSLKQEVVKKAVEDLNDSWGFIAPVWNVYSSTIDNSIKLMIANILDFIQDYEYHKEKGLEYSSKPRLELFKNCVTKTLKKKSINEIIEIIKEYSVKDWNSLDPFKKSLNNFFDSNLTLDTVKSNFEVFGGIN